MAKASQVVIMEGEYYIIKSPNGKVLEVKDFNTENGAGIQLWSYAGHPWQQWQFVDAGEGRWRIQNRFTGKMIDLALGGVVEGTWLHQWSRTSGLSQCWALEPTRSGRTRIRNVLADKYIDLVGMNTANGAQAQIWNYVADFISGILTREQFWILAKFKHPTHQIAFCSEKALSCLSFQSSQEVAK